MFDGDEVHIPFELDEGVPILTFIPEGGRPLRFELDTGSGSSVLTPEAAAACHSTTQPSANYSFREFGGSYKGIGFAHVPSMQIGPVRFDNFDAAIEEMLDSDGVLGFAMFAGTLVTIDYPREQLILRHGGLPKPDGRRILPFRIKEGHIAVKATLCGRDVWLTWTAVWAVPRRS